MKLAYLALPLLLLGACSEQSAESYLHSAKLKIENKNYDAAIIELKNAIRTEPSFAEARFLLGKSYLENHQYPQAEKELERALELNYSAKKIVPLLSKSYQTTGADNALLDLPLKKVDLPPEQAAEVYFYKLQAFINLKQTEKAKNFIKKIKALNTDSPFKHLSFVYNFLLEEKSEAANIALDELLKLHPLHAEALKLKANLLFRNQDIDAAIAVYRNYVAQYPSDVEISFVFARILTDKNQTAEAEPIIDKLLTINSNNPLLNQLKAIARFNDKDFSSAFNFAESALIKSSDDTPLRLIAGVSAYYQSNFEKAHQHLSLIASQLPPSHQALRLLAASQLKLGLSLEANETIEQFENITTKDSALLSSVGLALVDKGQVGKAKKLLDKAPNSAQTPEELARLGLLKMSLNDISGILNLEEALDNIKSPEQEQPIGRVLATAYLTTGQFDKAHALAASWKKHETTQLEGFTLSGLTFAKSREFSKAKAAFEEALKLSPKNPQVQMALIELKISTDETYTTKQELAALSKILDDSSNFIPALTRSFILSQETGTTNDIIAKTKQAIATFPKQVALKLTLSKMQYAEQLYTEALSTLSSLPLSETTSAGHWAILGQSYLQLGDFPAAIKLYEKWLSYAPTNSEAVIGNTVLLESQREYQKALNISQEYLERLSNNEQTPSVQMQILHIHLLVLNKEFDQAESMFDKLSEQGKALPVSAGLLGQIQLHKRNYQAALPNLKTAYQHKSNPRNARLVYMCLTVLEQFKPAMNFLKTHLDNNPTDQANLMELALKQISFDTNAAISSYQKVISLNENNIVAHNNVAYLYLQQNALELAKYHGEKAHELNPNNSDVLDTLGQVALLTGENKQALEYLSKAVKQFSSTEKVNEVIFINYIEALYLNGKVSQANSRVTDATFDDPAIAKKAQQLKLKYNP